MADRRMLSKTILLSDNFLSMPVSTRDLYVFLCLNADDDGFVNNTFSVIRLIGATCIDLETLSNKGFILIFDDGVIVISHWKLQNYIPKDRYKPTKYIEHMKQIEIIANQYFFITNGQIRIEELSEKVDT